MLKTIDALINDEIDDEIGLEFKKLTFHKGGFVQDKHYRKIEKFLISSGERYDTIIGPAIENVKGEKRPITVIMQLEKGYTNTVSAIKLGVKFSSENLCLVLSSHNDGGESYIAKGGVILTKKRIFDKYALIDYVLTSYYKDDKHRK